MSHKRKTSYNTKSFIFSCLEHGLRQIEMRKWSSCLIILRNTESTRAIVHVYSTDKKYEFNIVLSGQLGPLISSGPGVNLTLLLPSLGGTTRMLYNKIKHGNVPVRVVKVTDALSSLYYSTHCLLKTTRIPPAFIY